MQIIAIIGLISISLALFIRNEKFMDEKLMIIGGVCLLIYSIHLNDLILIILQLIFIGAGIVDFYRQIKNKHHKAN